MKPIRCTLDKVSSAAAVFTIGFLIVYCYAVMNISKFQQRFIINTGEVSFLYWLSIHSTIVEELPTCISVRCLITINNTTLLYSFMQFNHYYYVVHRKKRKKERKKNESVYVQRYVIWDWSVVSSSSSSEIILKLLLVEMNGEWSSSSRTSFSSPSLTRADESESGFLNLEVKNCNKPQLDNHKLSSKIQGEM